MDILIPSVSAAGAMLIDPGASYEPINIIQIGISLVILVAGLCAVLFIIWGGVMLILSGGRDEKVKPAFNSIRYAIIGVIVIVIAVFVAPRFWAMLGLEVDSYLSPKAIFDTIKILANRIFGASGSGIGGGAGGSSDINFTDL